jgi:hypothetical protein
MMYITKTNGRYVVTTVRKGLLRNIMHSTGLDTPAQVGAYMKANLRFARKDYTEHVVFECDTLLAVFRETGGDMLLNEHHRADEGELYAMCEQVFKEKYRR